MIEGINMDSRDKEMLAVYRKTASFTMQALGETLSGLRKGISNGYYSEYVDIKFTSPDGEVNEYNRYY